MIWRFLTVLLLAGSAAAPAIGATVTATGVIASPSASSIEALDATVTISEGDLVTLNYRAPAGQAIRIDVTGNSGFSIWAFKPLPGPFDISNIELSFDGFVTDSASTGTATRSQQSGGNAHLGPSLFYSDLGVGVGEFF